MLSNNISKYLSKHLNNVPILVENYQCKHPLNKSYPLNRSYQKIGSNYLRDRFRSVIRPKINFRSINI